MLKELETLSRKDRFNLLKKKLDFEAARGNMSIGEIAFVKRAISMFYSDFREADNFEEVLAS